MLTKARTSQKYDLEVLGIPFGGHRNGKDDDGEYFHKGTKVSRHNVPILYAHGTQLGFKGQVYGVTEEMWEEADGFWYGVNIFEDAELDIDGKKCQAKQQFKESASKGMLFASTGSLMGATLDIDRKTGAINEITVAELSLIDKSITPTISPKNRYAVARVKALDNFKTAGLLSKCSCELFNDEANTKGEEKPMSLLQRLQNLLNGKQESDPVTVSELQSLLKAGVEETDVQSPVTTTTKEIQTLIDNAVATAKAEFQTQLNGVTAQTALMKAQAEQNAFNGFLSSQLNIRLKAEDIQKYNEIYDGIKGLPDADREKVVTSLKAQIQEKTPLSVLAQKGVIILDNEEIVDSEKEAMQEKAELAQIAVKAGAQIYGKKSTQVDDMTKFAQQQLANVGGAK